MARLFENLEKLFWVDEMSILKFPYRIWKVFSRLEGPQKTKLKTHGRGPPTACFLEPIWNQFSENNPTAGNLCL